MKIILKNKVQKKLLLLQRNEFLSPIQIKIRKLFGRSLFTSLFINYFQHNNLSEIISYEIEKEFNIFKNFIPKNIETVMDIGCGIGLINIFLNENYKNINQFYLLDQNKIDKKIKYGFSKNYESYNDLSATKETLILNNIDEKKINLIDVKKNYVIKEKSIDLVISLVSMGYHYPISNYIQLLRKTCNNNTVFIFDIATEYQDLNIIKNYFNYYEILEKIETKHPRLRLFCSGMIL
ncbi:hypothetical protein N9E32_00595 [Alphaproteobacteria bacterium]|nr:hypothetical protein [Alphaproteobacteria bacterium]